MLPERLLSKPNGADYYNRYTLNRITRLMGTCLRGDSAEIAQWEEVGVLGRAMSGKLSARIKYDGLEGYGAILPALWLSAMEAVRSREALIKPTSAPLEEMTSTWEKLVSMLPSHPSQEVLDDWLARGANLPLAGRLVQMGANPHAWTPLGGKGPNATPFVALLIGWCKAHWLEGAKRPGWPQPAKEKQEQLARLMAWLEDPRLTPAQATRSLEILAISDVAGKVDPRAVDQIRATLVSKGAHVAPGLLSCLGGKMENGLGSPRWTSWVQILSDTRMELPRELPAEWKKPLPWAHLLVEPRAHETCLRFSRNFQNQSWSSTLSFALRPSGFNRDPALFTYCMQNLPALVDGFSMVSRMLSFDYKTRVDFAEGVLSCNPLIAPDLFEKVMDLAWKPKQAREADLPPDLSRVWMKSCLDTEGSHQRLVELAGLLHAKGGFDFLLLRERSFDDPAASEDGLRCIVGQEDEGSQGDWEMAALHHQGWLSSPRLRQVLSQTDPLLARRVRALAPLFLGEEDVGKEGQIIAQSLAENPAMFKGMLQHFGFRASKQTNDSGRIRGLFELVVLLETAESIPAHDQEQKNALWRQIAECMRPWNKRELPMDLYKRLAAGAERVASVPDPWAGVLSVLLLEEKASGRDWSSLAPLLDLMGDAPLRIGQVEEGLGGFAGAVRSIIQARRMKQDVPTVNRTGARRRF